MTRCLSWILHEGRCRHESGHEGRCEADREEYVASVLRHSQEATRELREAELEVERQVPRYIPAQPAPEPTSRDASEEQCPSRIEGYGHNFDAAGLCRFCLLAGNVTKRPPVEPSRDAETPPRCVHVMRASAPWHEHGACGELEDSVEHQPCPMGHPLGECPPGSFDYHAFEPPVPSSGAGVDLFQQLADTRLAYAADQISIRLLQEQLAAVTAERDRLQEHHDDVVEAMMLWRERAESAEAEREPLLQRYSQAKEARVQAQLVLREIAAIARRNGGGSSQTVMSGYTAILERVEATLAIAPATEEVQG